MPQEPFGLKYLHLLLCKFLEEIVIHDDVLDFYCWIIQS